MGGLKVAVVGSGVSGLAAAWTLVKAGCHVTLYEADDHVGGHAWTVEVEPGLSVDVGFMVFNRVTYPHMVAFFEEIGVEMEDSNMSFAVSLDAQRGGCEWGSNGITGLFAQRRNLLNPFFYFMIREMLRFKTDVERYLDALEAGDKSLNANDTLGDFLARHGYSAKFKDCYLVPVCASIWSCGPVGVLGFSASSVLSFLKNHHMLQLLGRPQWLTVKNRSKTYVQKIVGALEALGSQVLLSTAVTRVTSTDTGVEIEDSRGQVAAYDRCVMAAHAPDSLSLLGEGATFEQRRVLGAFQYSSSHIFLHRDPSLMPRRTPAWSAWNFLGSCDGTVCVTYWLNLLQNLGNTGPPVLVTLNPPSEPAHILKRWQASHPLPSPAATSASRELGTIQGKGGLWFCGAYTGYGFHEDGFKSGVMAAKVLLGETFTPLPFEPKLTPTLLEQACRWLVLRFLAAFIHIGSLQVLEAGGGVLTLGARPQEGQVTAPGAVAGGQALSSQLRITNAAFYWKVATRADLGLADAYVDGDFSCVGGSDGLLQFLLLLIANRDRLRHPGTKPNRNTRGWWSPALLTAVIGSAALYVRHLFRGNSLTKARRNIADHYDLDPGEDLRQAQMRKLHRLIDKARIESHHHVLEVGFGWGSLAIETVKRTGCRYTGITLSGEQLKLAQQRVDTAGLGDRIDFRLCDYRMLPGVGTYDRIMSCEMLEAVGHEYLGDFYFHCDRLLKMDGLLVVQVITTPEERYKEYRRSSDFIKEYIFPGCCVPAFAALTTAMAAHSCLTVEHVENIGPHYALTLLRWRDNFLKRAEEVKGMGFSAKFVRMWDYYFVYCAAGFKTCTLGDLQIVYSRSGNMVTAGDPYDLVCDSFTSEGVV